MTTKTCPYRFSPEDENENGIIRGGKIYCREKHCTHWNGTDCKRDIPVAGVWI